MKYLSIVALWIVLLIVMTGCSDDEPLQPVTYQGVTATQLKTPIPLVLTPITTPETLPSLPQLTNSQSSKSTAISGNYLITVNADSDSITLVDRVKNEIVKEIHVGDDPRMVTVTPDGLLALVTLRGDHAVAVVDLQNQRLQKTISAGHMPYGVVTDGRRAFISSFGSDAVVVIDIDSGKILYEVSVSDAPAGMALSNEWLLVTHFYTGDLSLINVLRTPVLVGKMNAETDGLIAQSIVISPDGEYAYLPQTRTGLSLISLQYMQDWFPVVSVLNIPTMTVQNRLVLSAMDGLPANMPLDAAFSANGEVLFIVLGGSDAVAVVDLAKARIITRIPVGINPSGIVIDDDRGYVLNSLDGTVSIIDTMNYRVVDTVQITEIPLNPILLRGKILFHRADGRMSDGAISCATCHFDGGADRRTWINYRSGPRNTPMLGNAAALPPYNWAGEMAEIHDSIEDQIRFVMLGDGLIEGEFDPTSLTIDAGRSTDLDALAAYVASFEPWPSPNRNADGTLSEAARRGMQIFMSGSPDCRCHGPTAYTNQQQHNLANFGFSLEEFDAFDTPTLYGLWATAPYMHDGVVLSLQSLLSSSDPVHSVADQLTAQQLADLIAFLLSL